MLEGITFRAEPGQTVAIVGQTGSGKSSIAKLINRTYDADDGEVLVDGVDVRDWNLEALRRQISIIEQDIFLFSRTVAENIAFGCPSATREESGGRGPGGPGPRVHHELQGWLRYQLSASGA